MTDGKVIKFPKKSKHAKEKDRWENATACLQEIIDDIKAGKCDPDFLFIGVGENFKPALVDPSPSVQPKAFFHAMGMNTMEVVGFLNFFTSSILRGDTE